MGFGLKVMIILPTKTIVLQILYIFELRFFIIFRFGTLNATTIMSAMLLHLDAANVRLCSKILKEELFKIFPPFTPHFLRPTKINKRIKKKGKIATASQKQPKEKGNQNQKQIIKKARACP